MTRRILILAALLGCKPNLPPRANCAALTQQCVNRKPVVCSGDQRFEPLQDTPCAPDEACVVSDAGEAHCVLAPDAAPVDAAVDADEVSQ